MSTNKKTERWANQKAEKAVAELNEPVKPQPIWVQAFMIMLLHERAILKQQLSGKPHPPQITLSLDDLRRFEALESGNTTTMIYDNVNRAVTIAAPEVIMPDMPKVVIQDKTIITGD